jgi:hypothetical protein
MIDRRATAIDMEGWREGWCAQTQACPSGMFSRGEFGKRQCTIAIARVGEIGRGLAGALVRYR